MASILETKLVTKKSDGGNLNTGTGITSEITQKTKMTGVDKIESINNKSKIQVSIFIEFLQFISYFIYEN